MNADKNHIVSSDAELLRQNTPKPRVINIKGKLGKAINYQSLRHIEISKILRKYQEIYPSVEKVQNRIIFAVCLFIVAIVLSLF